VKIFLFIKIVLGCESVNSDSAGMDESKQQQLDDSSTVNLVIHATTTI
jgi:hypothetical protein